jgi:hypothetical protein
MTTDNDIQYEYILILFAVYSLTQCNFSNKFCLLLQLFYEKLTII